MATPGFLRSLFGEKKPTANLAKERLQLVTPAPNGGTWMGKFILTTFNVTAALGEKISVAIEMQSDGVIAWTPAV